MAARTVRLKNKGGAYRGRHDKLEGQFAGDELHVEAGEEFLTDEATAQRLFDHHGDGRFELLDVGGGGKESRDTEST